MHHIHPQEASLKFLILRFHFIILFILSQSNQGDSDPYPYLCANDDHTNQDSPLLIVTRNVCNYVASPVKIYVIERELIPYEEDDSIRFCLKGDHLEEFGIIKKSKEEYHLILNSTLQVDELIMSMLTIKIEKKSEIEFRRTICGIKFKLTIEDCNRITWQTIAVIILSSFSVLLLSTLAIMLILYQQRGLIGKDHDEDDQDERPGNHFSSIIRDSTFINPRRTSSYEFTTLSKQSSVELERQDTHEL